MRSSTKYDVTPKTNVCVNPNCPNGRPHYAEFGEPAHRNCGTCDKPMRRIKGEPYGIKHPA